MYNLIFFGSWVMNICRLYFTASSTEKKTPRWEQDYHLQLMGKLGLFYEYLEMSKSFVKFYVI